MQRLQKAGSNLLFPSYSNRSMKYLGSIQKALSHKFIPIPGGIIVLTTQGRSLLKHASANGQAKPKRKTDADGKSIPAVQK